MCAMDIGITKSVLGAVSSCLLAGIASAGVVVQAEPSAPTSQVTKRQDPSRSVVLETVALEGFVVEPDGTPAEGAVVVSSAGGRAITDATGAYRLVVALPSDARDVQITAVGNGGTGRLANASVVPSAGRATRVQPLTLALGASCSPRWLPTFGPQPGTDLGIHAFTVHDDGRGPALYVGGGFDSAGGILAARIARWDGTHWEALGSGFDSSVYALAVYDDGSGPKLYAGGTFRNSGGGAVSRIARWDGASWSALGAGVNGAEPVQATSVRALLVHDDGSGAQLYVAGEFTSAGGLPANRIARWNGTAWSALGSGLGNGQVPTAYALLAHDDGSGPALYVGGGFQSAGGVTVRNLARWNGASWSALGTGTSAAVRALVSFDAGTGAALYAGGEFTQAGGVTTGAVARWDGTSWSALGSGTSSAVHALHVFDDGNGPALYAGGHYATAGGAPANGIARWDGSTWSPLASGMIGGIAQLPEVMALATFEHGGAPRLFAGGYLTSAGGIAASRLALWDGASWSALGSGVIHGVVALAVFDDGRGPALYVGGDLASVGGVPVRSIARWDGKSWEALGQGLEMLASVPGEDPLVLALLVYDDGTGPALYAGGRFQLAGGLPASCVARWDGSSWSSVGSGMGGLTLQARRVLALAAYDSGSGPALYAGGSFTSAGGVPASCIARWDGVAWHALGAGTDPTVRCLAVYDDGSGPSLYAGGDIQDAGTAAVSGIARWDGATWHDVPGLRQRFSSPTVNTLLVFDDGGGSALYAGGIFDVVAGQLGPGFARWRNGSWASVGHVLGTVVYALGAFDDGHGLALHASGAFFGRAGIGRWDGAGWTMLGGTISANLDAHISIALLAHDDGTGPALFSAGSSFDAGDINLSKWGFPADLDPPELVCPASVQAVDEFGGPSGELVTFTVTASDCRDPAPSVVCVPPSGSFFPRGTTLVTCTAVDVAGNQATCQFPVTVALKVRRH